MDRKDYLQTIEKVIGEGRYKDNWDSLSGHQMPKWLREGKFGIFIHWGVYSVPGFGNEWYSRNMYIQGSPEYEHHIKTYGKHAEFGYKDFIPLFKADKFDPEAWAELFSEAGAKYVVPVAEHHDGFQMYKSEVSHWNAYEMGPKRDVLGELSAAVREKGMVNGASSHRVEHWFFMSHGKEFESDIKEPMAVGDFYWPAMEEKDHLDMFSEPVPTKEFLDDWLIRCCELVDQFKPLEFYFDWWILHSSVKPYLKKFIAYYYNRALEWGKEVTVCYKHDACAFGTATLDLERGKFKDAQPFYWQTDTAIARNSWCWTENNAFKPADSLVRELVDVVSKNGVMLLNVGPKPDGSFSDEDTAILKAIGKWLKTNGEAIYGTTVWRRSSEGPTQTKEGQFTDGEDTVFTHEDIRFTAKGEHLYATFLKWPEDGKATVKAFSAPGVFQDAISHVEILGHEIRHWHRDDKGLHIDAPGIDTVMPVTVKVTIA